MSVGRLAATGATERPSMNKASRTRAACSAAEKPSPRPRPGLLPSDSDAFDRGELGIVSPNAPERRFVPKGRDPGSLCHGRRRASTRVGEPAPDDALLHAPVIVAPDGRVGLLGGTLEAKPR